MPEPFNLPGTSPRHGLAYLYPGQAQKEAFVNEALSRIDILLHARIKGIAAAPPADPEEGDCWLIAPAATGAWSSHANHLAGWSAGSWVYCAPHPGMRVWDSGAAQQRVFSTSWTAAPAVTPATGGSVVDSQARATITALITALKESGVLAQV